MNHLFSEKPVRRRRVYKGQAVDFWVDTIRMPSGHVAKREYLGHPGAVAVVSLLDSSANPRILFVRQFRYPVRETTLELPAGKLARGESPRQCLRRELEEETGYRPGRVRKIVSYWPTPAFADEIIHIYTADRLQQGKFNPDEDEAIEPVVLKLKDALQKVREGAIKDSKTIIGLLAYAHWRKR